MIKLNRFNGEEFVINAELIEEVKSTPDTVIKLTTHRTILVKESVDEVIKKVINYKRKINNQFLEDGSEDNGY